MKNVITVVLIAILIAGVVWVAKVLTADPSKDDSFATPTITPTPEATPINPSLIVNVDTTTQGDVLTVNGHSQKQTVECKKYDRVFINGSGSTAIIKGACSQVMVNGDQNHLTADAVTEFVFNGTTNEVTYSRFVNGKLPRVTENQAGNDVRWAAPTAAKPAATPKSK